MVAVAHRLVDARSAHLHVLYPRLLIFSDRCEGTRRAGRAALAAQDAPLGARVNVRCKRLVEPRADAVVVDAVVGTCIATLEAPRACIQEVIFWERTRRTKGEAFRWSLAFPP